MNDLWERSAVEVVQLLKHGQVSPEDLLDIVEARLKVVEPQINAVPIICMEQARAAAKALKIPKQPGPGYLYGLPIVVKDSTPVKGMPWTCGSPIFKDRVADEDDPYVENLKLRGAIIIGKSNLPELSAGATTYNDLFGATRNPWDPGKTCGGSSGGTAAALAAGEVWLGTGGDLGGSLRIPASFCGIVGFRPSVGLVPQRFCGFEAVKAVSGPMARNTADLALLLDALVGQHPRDPESLPAPVRSFQLEIQEGAQLPIKRAAWSPDLNGMVSVDPEVVEICGKAARWFQSQGAALEEACPDLSDADDIFQTLRAASYSKAFTAVRDDAVLGPLLKPELHWQIDKGTQQSQNEVEEALNALEAYRCRVAAFFEEFEILCTPCVMTSPFDVSIRWPTALGTKSFTNYVEWLIMTFAFSLVDIPAICIPCGLTASGLPVGLQICGAHNADARVMWAAAQYERHHSWADLVPTLRGKK